MLSSERCFFPLRLLHFKILLTTNWDCFSHANVDNVERVRNGIEVVAQTEALAPKDKYNINISIKMMQNERKPIIFIWYYLHP